MLQMTGTWSMGIEAHAGMQVAEAGMAAGT